MSHESTSCERSSCPMEYSMNQIAGKWKIVILWYIASKKIIRYSELKRSCSSITHKMLSQQLGELIDSGIIHKTTYPQIPPKTEYSLTSKGNDLIPILELMREWGNTYKNDSILL